MNYSILIDIYAHNNHTVLNSSSTYLRSGLTGFSLGLHLLSGSERRTLQKKTSTSILEQQCRELAQCHSATQRLLRLSSERSTRYYRPHTMHKGRRHRVAISGTKGH